MAGAVGRVRDSGASARAQKQVRHSRIHAFVDMSGNLSGWLRGLAIAERLSVAC